MELNLYDFKHIFLDQSVIGRLVDGRHDAIDFSKVFQKSLLETDLFRNAELYLVHSPFSLIELLGLRRKLIIPFSDHTRALDRKLSKLKGDTEAVKVEVYKYFESKFLEIPEIKQEFLSRVLRNKHDKFSSKFGQLVLKHLETYFVNQRGIESILAQALALDRVYGYPYKNGIAPQIEESFFVDILRNLSMGRDFNQCRGIQRAFAKLIESEEIMKLFDQQNDTPEKRENYQKEISSILDAIEFEQNKDLVDMEVAHYSNVGKFSSDGQLVPVVCFTMDNPVQTKKRAAFMKNAVQFVCNMFRDKFQANENIPFTFIEPQPGAIAYVSAEGVITSIDMISDLDDLFHISDVFKIPKL
jgi:hypothetical protein